VQHAISRKLGLVALAMLAAIMLASCQQSAPKTSISNAPKTTAEPEHSAYIVIRETVGKIQDYRPQLDGGNTMYNYTIRMNHRGFNQIQFNLQFCEAERRETYNIYRIDKDADPIFTFKTHVHRDQDKWVIDVTDDIYPDDPTRYDLSRFIEDYLSNVDTIRLNDYRMAIN
jgi:hypothetical protein